MTAVGATRLQLPHVTRPWARNGRALLYDAFLHEQGRERKCKTDRRHPSAAFSVFSAAPSCPVLPRGHTFRLPPLGQEQALGSLAHFCSLHLITRRGPCQDLCQVLTDASSWRPRNNPGEAYHPLLPKMEAPGGGINPCPRQAAHVVGLASKPGLSVCLSESRLCLKQATPPRAACERGRHGSEVLWNLME